MFLVIISISIYNFGIYLILVLSICNAIRSADCHVRYFNKLSISQLNYRSPVKDNTCNKNENETFAANNENKAQTGRNFSY